MSSDPIRNVRDRRVLGQVIGQKVLDITVNAPDEMNQPVYVMLMFESGHAIKFWLTPLGFQMINFDNTPESKT